MDGCVQEMLLEWENIHMEHQNLIKLYTEDPKQHPLYNQEWVEFVKNRSTSILSLGVCPIQYDFSSEFKTYWPCRVKELMHVEWEKRVRNYRSRMTTKYGSEVASVQNFFLPKQDPLLSPSTESAGTSYSGTLVGRAELNGHEEFVHNYCRKMRSLSRSGSADSGKSLPVHRGDRRTLSRSRSREKYVSQRGDSMNRSSPGYARLESKRRLLSHKDDRNERSYSRSRSRDRAKRSSSKFSSKENEERFSRRMGNRRKSRSCSQSKTTFPERECSPFGRHSREPLWNMGNGVEEKTNEQATRGSVTPEADVETRGCSVKSRNYDCPKGKSKSECLPLLNEKSNDCSSKDRKEGYGRSEERTLIASESKIEEVTQSSAPKSEFSKANFSSEKGNCVSSNNSINNNKSNLSSPKTAFTGDSTCIENQNHELVAEVLPGDSKKEVEDNCSISETERIPKEYASKEGGIVSLEAACERIENVPLKVNCDSKNSECLLGAEKTELSDFYSCHLDKLKSSNSKGKELIVRKHSSACGEVFQPSCLARHKRASSASLLGSDSRVFLPRKLEARMKFQAHHSLSSTCGSTVASKVGKSTGSKNVLAEVDASEKNETDSEAPSSKLKIDHKNSTLTSEEANVAQCSSIVHEMSTHANKMSQSEQSIAHHEAYSLLPVESTETKGSDNECCNSTDVTECLELTESKKNTIPSRNSGLLLENSKDPSKNVSPETNSLTHKSGDNQSASPPVVRKRKRTLSGFKTATCFQASRRPPLIAEPPQYVSPLYSVQSYRVSHRLSALKSPRRCDSPDGRSKSKYESSRSVRRYESAYRRSKSICRRWKSGDRRSRSGDRRSRVDERRSRADERRSMSDERRSRSGDRRSRADERRSRSGDWRSRSGDRRSRSGDRRSRADERRSRSGDWRSRADERRSRSGDRRSRPGDGRSRSGNRRSRSGNRRSRSVHRRSRSGHRRSRSGHRRSRSGHRRSRSGHRRSRSGHRRSRSGHRRSRSGLRRSRSGHRRSKSSHGLSGFHIRSNLLSRTGGRAAFSDVLISDKGCERSHSEVFHDKVRALNSTTKSGARIKPNLSELFDSSVISHEGSLNHKIFKNSRVNLSISERDPEMHVEIVPSDSPKSKTSSKPECKPMGKVFPIQRSADHLTAGTSNRSVDTKSNFHSSSCASLPNSEYFPKSELPLESCTAVSSNDLVLCPEKYVLPKEMRKRAENESRHLYFIDEIEASLLKIDGNLNDSPFDNKKLTNNFDSDGNTETQLTSQVSMCELNISDLSERHLGSGSEFDTTLMGGLSIRSNQYNDPQHTRTTSEPTRRNSGGTVTNCVKNAWKEALKSKVMPTCDQFLNAGINEQEKCNAKPRLRLGSEDMEDSSVVNLPFEESDPRGYENTRGTKSPLRDDLTDSKSSDLCSQGVNLVKHFLASIQSRTPFESRKSDSCSSNFARTPQVVSSLNGECELDGLNFLENSPTDIPEDGVREIAANGTSRRADLPNPSQKPHELIGSLRSPSYNSSSVLNHDDEETSPQSGPAKESNLKLSSIVCEFFDHINKVSKFDLEKLSHPFLNLTVRAKRVLGDYGPEAALTALLEPSSLRILSSVEALLWKNCRVIPGHISRASAAEKRLVVEGYLDALSKLISAADVRDGSETAIHGDQSQQTNSDASVELKEPLECKQVAPPDDPNREKQRDLASSLTGDLECNNAPSIPRNEELCGVSESQVRVLEPTEFAKNVVDRHILTYLKTCPEKAVIEKKVLDVLFGIDFKKLLPSAIKDHDNDEKYMQLIHDCFMYTGLVEPSPELLCSVLAELRAFESSK